MNTINFTVDYNDVFGKAVEEAGSYNVKIGRASCRERV